MSRPPCPVPTCDRPSTGGLMCGACQAELSRALDAVPEVVRELHTTLSRQTSRTTGGRPSETPLPYDARASEAAWVLRNALTGWVRVLCESSASHTEAMPADTCPSMAAWLSACLSRLVRHPAAEEAHGEIVSAVRAAERVVDRPAERQFAGYCACGAPLYARPGSPQVSCRECEAKPYKVTEQREWMLGQIEDQLANAAAAGAILRQMGVSIPDSTIRYFAQEKRILAHGTDANRRPLYRIGDVIETLSKRTQKAG